MASIHTAPEHLPPLAPPATSCRHSAAHLVEGADVLLAGVRLEVLQGHGGDHQALGAPHSFGRAGRSHSRGLLRPRSSCSIRRDSVMPHCIRQS